MSNEKIKVSWGASERSDDGEVIKKFIFILDGTELYGLVKLHEDLFGNIYHGERNEVSLYMHSEQMAAFFCCLEEYAETTDPRVSEILLIVVRELRCRLAKEWFAQRHNTEELVPRSPFLIFA